MSCLRIVGASRFTLDAPKRGDGTPDIELGQRKRIECVEANGSAGHLVIGDMAPGDVGQMIFNRVGQALEIEWTLDGYRIVSMRQPKGAR